MTMREQIFQILKDEGKLISSRYGVRRIGIFGSCARGEDKEGSDVDILVEFDRKTFDNYMGLKLFLEEKLGRSIDLVTTEALKPALRDEILKEVQYAA